jgi:hypothetical protein
LRFVLRVGLGDALEQYEYHVESFSMNSIAVNMIIKAQPVISSVLRTTRSGTIHATDTASNREESLVGYLVEAPALSVLPNNPLKKLDLVSIQLMFLLDSFELLLAVSYVLA